MVRERGGIESDEMVGLVLLLRFGVFAPPKSVYTEPLDMSHILL